VDKKYNDISVTTVLLSVAIGVFIGLVLLGVIQLS